MVNQFTIGNSFLFNFISANNLYSSFKLDLQSPGFVTMINKSHMLW